MELFGSSGTRGVVNEQLTPAFVVEVAAAAGTVLDAGRIAVARDTRLTGLMLANAAASGLSSVGVDVLRLGVLPTPGVQAFARHHDLPAIVLTASHNPPEYNGVKLVGADGVELSTSELERIENTVLEGDQGPVPWDRTGRERRVTDGVDRYIEEVVSHVDRDRIAGADFTVALDPGHGAASITSPEIFRRLGCRVVTVNGQLDGHFPGRNPEPIEANLTDLGRLVRAADADVGVAHDGDGDRAIFYDELGNYVEGDASLAALAAESLGSGDTAVAAVNVSQRLVDVVGEADASLVLTPIGSTNIVTRIRQLLADGERVPIAGEGNGGIYFPHFALRRDGAFIASRFLELMASMGRSVSELVSPFDAYHNVRHNIPYRNDAERSSMWDSVESIADTAARNEDVTLTRTDGIRFDYGDAWVLVRPSGTEPLIRIYAEGREFDRPRKLADELYEAIVEATEEG